MRLVWNKQQQYQKAIGLFITLVALLCGCAAPLTDGSQTSETSNDDTEQLVTVTAEVQSEEYSATIISGFLYTSQLICTKKGTVSGDTNIAGTATLILNDACTSFSFSPNYPLFCDPASGTCTVSGVGVATGTGTYYYPVSGANTVTATGQVISLATSANSATVALYAYVTSTTAFAKVSTSPTFTFTIGTTGTGTAVSANASLISPTVGAGDSYSCALTFPGGVRTAGKVYCWGKNTSSFGNSFNFTTPTALTSGSFLNLPSSIVSLYVGDELLCVLTSSNALWCLGYWANAQHTSFAQISGTGLSGTIYQVVLGYKSGCALTSTNASNLYCWGNVDFAASAAVSPALLDGTGSNIQTLNFGGTISQFAVANDTSGSTYYGSVCAIVAGAVKCIGNNTYYQLGNGTNTYSSTSVAVSGITGTVMKISAKNQTYCALTISKATYCWGQANDFKTPVSSSVFEYNMFGSLVFSTIASTAEYQEGYRYFYDTQITSAAYTNFGYTPSGSAYNFPTTNSNSGYTYLATATPLTQSGTTVSLNAVSVGMSNICGANAGTVSCFGVDLTSATALSAFTATSPNQIGFSKYDYGSLGYITGASYTYSGNYSDYYCQQVVQSCTGWNYSTDKNYCSCATRWPYYGDSNSGFYCVQKSWTTACGWYFNACIKCGDSTTTCSGYSASIINTWNNNTYSSGSALSANSSTASSNTYYTSTSTNYPYSYKGINYTKSASTSSNFYNTFSSSVYAISVGSNYQNSNSFGHVCAVLVNGAIYCWGGNDVNQSGAGSTSTPIMSSGGSLGGTSY